MTANAMSASPGEEEVRQALERLLASRRFARAERHSRFLRYIVDETLTGKGHQLKESLLGAEVFGRPADYDPRVDPVVRVEATKLRGRLEEYYREDGAAEPVVIDFPRGGYVPQFRYREVAVVAEEAEGAATPGGVPAAAHDVLVIPRRGPSWAKRGLVGAAVAALAVALWLGWHLQAGPRERVVAVLPLEDLSAGRTGTLPEALTAELRARLVKSGGVKVVSKTSSRAAVKGSAASKAPLDAPAIGRELGADLLVEGSMRQAGEEHGAKLAVVLQLVDARSGLVVWTGRYECDPSLWDEKTLEGIAREIRTAVRARGA
jgi:TolB-like protein